MAFTETKTDWSSSDLMTYDEWNRIAANINAIYDAGLSEDMTQNDILDAATWSTAVSAINIMAIATGLSTSVSLGTTIDAATINSLEQWTQDIADRIDLIMLNTNAKIYAGDDLYASASIENYARGGSI